MSHNVPPRARIVRPPIKRQSLGDVKAFLVELILSYRMRRTFDELSFRSAAMIRRRTSLQELLLHKI